MSGADDVDAWLERTSNPQKALMQAVRRVLVTADRRIAEEIKWQAPTFVYKGNIASFMPRATKFVGLMFHKGAEISGNFPGLTGSGTAARTFRIENSADLHAKSGELVAIMRTWCDLRDAG